jgi:hypothetical protein
MTGTDEITNSEDIIDSRDVIARIGWLEGEDCGDEKACDLDDCPRHVEDAAEELRQLKELDEEGSGLADWPHGETLIRDSYFEDYAEQYADGVGAINAAAGWPLNHIDWEAAADELKMDYTSIKFGDVTYWARG